MSVSVESYVPAVAVAGATNLRSASTTVLPTFAPLSAEANEDVDAALPAICAPAAVTSELSGFETMIGLSPSWAAGIVFVESPSRVKVLTAVAAGFLLGLMFRR